MSTVYNHVFLQFLLQIQMSCLCAFSRQVAGAGAGAGCARGAGAGCRCWCWCCELAVRVVETGCRCRVPVLRDGCARGGDRVPVPVLGAGCARLARCRDRVPGAATSTSWYIQCFFEILLFLRVTFGSLQVV